MPNGNESEVTIKLDGLLLYRFDEVNNICEVKVHTYDGSHQMAVKVEEPGNVLFDDKFSSEMLKDLHPLSIFVAEGSGLDPVGDSATKGASYDLILDLEGDDFYSRSLEVRSGRYECSLFIRNGSIDAGDRNRGCFRVEKPIFNHLKLHWENEPEFEAFKGAKVKVGKKLKKTSDLMLEFGKQIAVNVRVKLTFGEGKALRMVSGASNSDIFPPLAHGKDYVIDIKYLDVNAPMGLEDDLGFAHHSAAMKLKAGEPIFGLFQPIFDDLPVNPATPPGCCISCRVSPEIGDLNLQAESTGIEKKAAVKAVKKPSRKIAKSSSKKSVKKSKRNPKSRK
jgi:hypothetical protein